MPKKVDNPPPAGEVIEAALSTLQRWSAHADIRKSLREAGGAVLSNTDSWLLERIAADGPIRMSQLAGWLAVDKSTMTSEIRRLQQAGLVVREADKNDRRAILVSATEAGLSAITQHREVAQEMFNSLLVKWNAVDRNNLALLLGRFVDELTPPTEAPGATGRGIPATTKRA
ncbi:MAG: MarR family transcriptional regulator [Glaciihabitans sp.]|nr:MarR family transcriptional regulator [Glaciihabitans sp.]